MPSGNRLCQGRADECLLRFEPLSRLWGPAQPRTAHHTKWSASHLPLPSPVLPVQIVPSCPASGPSRLEPRLQPRNHSTINLGGSPSALGKVPGPSITKPVQGVTEGGRCDKHRVRDGLRVPDHSLAHPAVEPSSVEEEECRGAGLGERISAPPATSAGSTRRAASTSANNPNQRAFNARWTSRGCPCFG